MNPEPKTAGSATRRDALAEEACVKARVQRRYYEFPIAVAPTADGWKVQLAGKGTSVEIRARQLVDCTGNASVAGMIGLSRRREKITQPGTLIYRLGGADLASLDLDALQVRAAAAVKSGELKLTDTNGGIAGFVRSGGESKMHVPGADSSTSESHTATNILGRQSILRVLRFLKAEPACAFMRIGRLQAETGVRETFRIVGETTVILDDYVTGRVFKDEVAHSFYPLDLHVEHGVRPEHLKEGIVPTIPRGALIPESSRNLMVAGRCLSSDRLAIPRCAFRPRAWRWARPRASPPRWRRGWEQRRRRWICGISGASWPAMGPSCQRRARPPEQIAGQSEGQRMAKRQV